MRNHHLMTHNLIGRDNLQLTTQRQLILLLILVIFALGLIMILLQETSHVCLFINPSSGNQFLKITERIFISRKETMVGIKLGSFRNIRPVNKNKK